MFVLLGIELFYFAFNIYLFSPNFILSRYNSYLELISSYSIFIFDMALMNGHRVNLSSDFGNNGSSHVVRLKTHASSDLNI